VAAVILAGGQGTRMKSALPKVLHKVAGVPMVVRALHTAAKLNLARRVIIVGHMAETVQAAAQQDPSLRAEFALQMPQLGTGHAVSQAASALQNTCDTVLVWYADMPLLRPETLAQLLEAHTANRAAGGVITMLTAALPSPRGFGRIVRQANGQVAAIVEERDCTPAQLAITELNIGVYAFDSAWLWPHLNALKAQPNGEYYLTDLVALAVSQSLAVQAINCDDPDEVIGINTRVHLAEAETSLRHRINSAHQLNGVTISDPATTYIDEGVEIGPDTIIYPNTYLQGRVKIGKNCEIGPNSLVRDSQIGDDNHVIASVVEEAITEGHVHVGPYGHLRKDAYLEEGVHMGNFGEVKNSRLGRDTRMGHFSYIGDAQIGLDVNIGAGTITVNYDGKNKHKTVIGNHAFIGSDTMLVAPIHVADNARTAAGAVVTRDVPTGYISVGVPGRLRPLSPNLEPESD
jgi:bifunctional UDP-N-acetylglucosamine pyrophosphorylase / glucosamine-1-phosphate N-acetyltransferase